MRHIFDGYVVGVADDRFTAIIRDLDKPESREDVVVFAIDAVPKRDRYMVQLGSAFFWHVGKRSSRIRFWRLPKLTLKCLQENR